MNGRRLCRLILRGGTAAVLWLALRWPAPAQPPSFDRLTEEDRTALGESFRREIWPFLARGGKDGCVGCHNGKRIPAPLFVGDTDKDFRMLLREGFFLKGDAGSLLALVQEPNSKRRMPPPPRPSWTDAEKKALSDFVDAIHQKQKP